MRNLIVWMLRLPFLGIIYAVFKGILEDSSELTIKDWSMSGGGISLCIGVCIAAGLLNKPMPTETQSKLYKGMRLFFGVAIAGVAFGKYL